jgi:FlaA1/EpsC-like NDP-sugar epimerase
MQNTVIAWPRTAKRLVVVALDVLLALLATWIAFTLRLDALHWPTGSQWWVYGLAPVLAIPVFIRWGLYRAIFRYSGQAALLATGQAVAIYAVLLVSVLVWQKWQGVPRSLGVLQPLIFLLLVGISRATARFWLANLGVVLQTPRGRMLIYGAGTSGVQTAMALGVSQEFKLLGFIDDDPGKAGRSVNGIAVLRPDQVPEFVTEREVTDIVLALPSATRARRNEIIKGLHSLPVHIRTLPDWSDLASGRVTVQDFRELDIEDLLGRDPVPPDTALIASHLQGQVVLVSGAGGSIGGELCRQIVQQHPVRLLLLDHNEFGLYTIHQELQAICVARQLAVELVPLLGSVANYPRLNAICAQYRPATIYHAAAYKHVPMVQSNAGQGVANNVLGTLNLARAAIECAVGRFVLISTDKAVRPTNVMGATKRMAELVLQALAVEPSPVFEAMPGAVQALEADDAQRQRTVNQTCFTMVRFGNVLGSSGSVVPLFRKQLAQGGPLTVTHAEVTRYFMTIPEAAQLVLQAGAMAHGGDVFVLDMGQPVKIIDLAARMVRLSGLTVRDAANPEGDVEITVTGLRPGEKLYEELLIGDNPQPTAHRRIMKAHEHFLPWSELQPELIRLASAAQADDLLTMQDLLQAHVHGYQTDGGATVNDSLASRF